MNTNIDISLLNNYFTNKGEKADKNNKKEKTQSKILPYCFFSINEINVVNIINKIPYKSNYYDVMIDYDFIDIGKIGENMIENVQLNNKKQYIMTHYNNKKYIDFQDFLFNNPDKKQFLFNIFNSYSKLLNSLITLNDKNVCFFDLNTYNIVFLENSMPILQNFQNGLIISELNESYIKQIIENIN